MPSWWATKAVLAISALCSIAAVIRWSMLESSRGAVTRTVRDWLTASVGGPDQAELDHTARVFANDMSSLMFFEALTVLIAVAALAWYLATRRYLVHHLGYTGRMAMRHKTVVAWRIVLAASVVLAVGVSPTRVQPHETLLEHGISNAYGRLSAMALTLIALAALTIAAVRVISQRVRYLLLPDA